MTPVPSQSLSRRASSVAPIESSPADINNGACFGNAVPTSSETIAAVSSIAAATLATCMNSLCHTYTLSFTASACCTAAEALLGRVKLLRPRQSETISGTAFMERPRVDFAKKLALTSSRHGIGVVCACLRTALFCLKTEDRHWICREAGLTNPRVCSSAAASEILSAGIRGASDKAEQQFTSIRTSLSGRSGAQGIDFQAAVLFSIVTLNF